jgi:hypothetical protein
MKTLRLVVATLAGLLAGRLCMAQVPVPVVDREPTPKASTPLPGEEVMRPTELGLRFTPELARAIGRKLASEGPFKQYGLDQDAREKVAEQVARRLMALAHASQSDGVAFLEWALPTLFESEGEFTPELGKRWSQHVTPLLPKFRQTVLDVIEDVRPLVPPEKQLAYARDMIGVTLVFDAMTSKMNRWAAGGAEQKEDPFDIQQEQADVERERAAHDNRLRQRWEQMSVNYAEDRLSMLTSKWPEYVDGAIKSYGFDEKQQQSARSVLEEMKNRAAQIMIKDWMDAARANRKRLWWGLRVEGGLWHPLNWRLKFEWQERVAPIEQLERELSSRLDEIATREQRASAKEQLDEKIQGEPSS